jgi:hypothetical protein
MIETTERMRHPSENNNTVLLNQQDYLRLKMKRKQIRDYCIPIIKGFMKIKKILNYLN